MGGMRVLVVDDDALVLTSLDAMLRSNGYVTSTAGSGAKAIEMLKREPHDLVLMDVIMRGMDGIDTLREIKRFLPDISVIFISGYPEPDCILEALSAGAADFIVKPCEEEEIIARIEEVLRRRQSGRENR
ncbi:MAG: response regulator [Candidatus Latescibacterota bacterium]